MSGSLSPWLEPLDERFTETLARATRVVRRGQKRVEETNKRVRYSLLVVRLSAFMKLYKKASVPLKTGDEMQGPKVWRTIAEQITREQDSDKFTELTGQLIQALDEDLKHAANEPTLEEQDSRDRSA